MRTLWRLRPERGGRSRRAPALAGLLAAGALQMAWAAAAVPAAAMVPAAHAAPPRPTHAPPRGTTAPDRRRLQSPTPTRLAVSPGPFRDVLHAFWAARAIGEIARRGLAFVASRHRFDPYGPELRGTFLRQVATAVLGHAPPAPRSTPFRDVPRTSAWAGPIAAADTMGWLTFPVGAVFAPQQPISRETAYTILARALLPAGTIAAADPAAIASYTDGRAVSPWAARPIAALAAAGYIPHGGFLRPRDRLDRADAAVLISEVLNTVRTFNGQRFRIVAVRTLRATTYGPGVPGMSTYTATGTLARPGEAAVDPASIPYGTYLWITGYAATPYLPANGALEHAEDTGMLGPNDIDLYISATSLWPYLQFGIQMVTARVLAPLPTAGA